jgi:hypothetical protein
VAIRLARPTSLSVFANISRSTRLKQLVTIIKMRHTGQGDV